MSPWLGALRIALGFAAPLLLVAIPELRLAAAPALLAGEAIGRAEYYMQLARRTPRHELDGALAGWASGEVHAGQL